MTWGVLAAAVAVCGIAPAGARVRRREGEVSLRLPPAGSGPYVVSASAFSRHGSRSRVVRAPLR